MIHLVALNRVPARPVPRFLAALKGNSDYFWKVMPNVWLADTGLDADDFAETLRAHITGDDSLLVIRTVGEYGGWLPKDVWQWLNRSASNGDFDD